MAAPRVRFQLDAFDSPEKEGAVVDRMAAALSGLCTISTEVRLQKGSKERGSFTVGAYDTIGTRRSRSGYLCVNCGSASITCSVLCARCKPLGVQMIPGKLFLQVMYEHSNPKYEFTPSRMMRLVELDEWRAAALDAECLCASFSNVASFLLDKDANANMRVNPEDNVSWTMYTTSISYTRGFRAGNLRLALQQEVCDRALDWVKQLDRWLQVAFGIQCVSSVEDSLRVERVHRELASAIACVVTGPNDGVATNGAVRLAENLSKQEFVRCFLTSERERAEDFARLRALHSLAVNGLPRDPDAITETRYRILQVLRDPPPELKRQAVQWAALNAADLSTALRDEDVAPEVRARLIDEWRFFGQTQGVVDVVCERACRDLQAHCPSKTHFVAVLSKTSASCNRVPAPTWKTACDKERRWRHVPAARVCSSRVDLDDVGKRIVFLSSAVWALLGDGDFVEPEVMCARMVRAVAHVERERASATVARIDQDRVVEEIGLDFVKAKRVFLDYRSTHLEDSIPEVMACLSNFSVSELFTAFHEDSPLFSQFHRRLVKATLAKMPVSLPNEGRYQSFVSTALPLMRYLLVDYRMHSIRSLEARPSHVGDVLRAYVAVRRWKPEDGPLRISVQETLHGSDRTRALLEDLRAMGGRGLLRFARVGTCKVYEFQVAALAAVLGPSPHSTP